MISRIVLSTSPESACKTQLQTKQSLTILYQENKLRTQTGISTSLVRTHLLKNFSQNNEQKDQTSVLEGHVLGSQCFLLCSISSFSSPPAEHFTGTKQLSLSHVNPLCIQRSGPHGPTLTLTIVSRLYGRWKTFVVETMLMCRCSGCSSSAEPSSVLAGSSLVSVTTKGNTTARFELRACSRGTKASRHSQIRGHWSEYVDTVMAASQASLYPSHTLELF